MYNCIEVNTRTCKDKENTYTEANKENQVIYLDKQNVIVGENEFLRNFKLYSANSKYSYKYNFCDAVELIKPVPKQPTFLKRNSDNPPIAKKL